MPPFVLTAGRLTAQSVREYGTLYITATSNAKYRAIRRGPASEMVAAKLMVLHPERVSSGTLGGTGWLRKGTAAQRFWEKIPAGEGSRTPAAIIRSNGKLAATEPQIKRFRVPVRVLVGDRDAVKQHYLAPLHRAGKDWTVVEIEDAGHIRCIIGKFFRDALPAWVRNSQ